MSKWRGTARRLIAGAQTESDQVASGDIDDVDPGFRQLADRVQPYTMTSDDKLYALYGAIRHIARLGIPGDVVECGVWRGGSSMLAALTLQLVEKTDRAIWLYDTFEGMPAPSERDADRFGMPAEDVLEAYEREPGANNPWAYATLADVEQNMAQTAYPNVHLIPGRVEETISKRVPEQISLLRLDTDWYESTRFELEHLYPRLQPGGILILDDYGWWRGARRAADEYLAQAPIFLVRIGNEGARIGIKPTS